MARKIEQFPDELRPGTIEHRYPWHEWLDGDAWELTHGEDFAIKVKSLRTNAQAVARKRGGRLKAAEHPDGKRLYIQFIPGLESPPEPAEEPLEPPAEPEPPAPRDTAYRDRTRAIRDWARTHGWPDLPERGRLPGDVIEAYERALVHPHGGTVHHLTPRA